MFCKVPFLCVLRVLQEGYEIFPEFISGWFGAFISPQVVAGFMPHGTHWWALWGWLAALLVEGGHHIGCHWCMYFVTVILSAACRDFIPASIASHSILFIWVSLNSNFDWM